MKTPLILIALSVVLSNCTNESVNIERTFVDGSYIKLKLNSNDYTINKNDTIYLLDGVMELLIKQKIGEGTEVRHQRFEGKDGVIVNILDSMISEDYSPRLYELFKGEFEPKNYFPVFSALDESIQNLVNNVLPYPLGIESDTVHIQGRGIKVVMALGTPDGNVYIHNSNLKGDPYEDKFSFKHGIPDSVWNVALTPLDRWQTSFDASGNVLKQDQYQREDLNSDFVKSTTITKRSGGGEVVEGFDDCNRIKTYQERDSEDNELFRREYYYSGNFANVYETKYDKQHNEVSSRMVKIKAMPCDRLPLVMDLH